MDHLSLDSFTWIFLHGALPIPWLFYMDPLSLWVPPPYPSPLSWVPYFSFWFCFLSSSFGSLYLTTSPSATQWPLYIKMFPSCKGEKAGHFWRDDFRIRRGNWHFCQTLESFRFKGCHRILKFPFPPLFLFSLLFDPTPALRAVCQKPNREGIRILSQIYSR